jgi:hypothetical protein
MDAYVKYFQTAQLSGEWRVDSFVEGWVEGIEYGFLKNTLKLDTTAPDVLKLHGIQIKNT